MRCCDGFFASFAVSALNCDVCDGFGMRWCDVFVCDAFVSSWLRRCDVSAPLRLCASALDCDDAMASRASRFHLPRCRGWGTRSAPAATVGVRHLNIFR